MSLGGDGSTADTTPEMPDEPGGADALPLADAGDASVTAPMLAATRAGEKKCRDGTDAHSNVPCLSAHAAETKRDKEVKSDSRGA